MKRDRPTPRQEAQLLGWVNRARRVFGKRPLKRLPKGAQRSGRGCPIAVALGAAETTNADTFGLTREQSDALVDAGLVRPDEFNGVLSPPKYVGDFADRFDRGDYPGLVQ